MNIVTKIKDAQEQVLQWKKQGLSVGFVPTMGALHLGHASLITKSKQTCDKTVVSIFVNPAQFAPNEDFEQYPRDLDKDCDMAQDYGADLVFAPSVTEMYGAEGSIDNNNFTFVIPPYFYVDKLCAKSRPAHFDGVCTVVLKLFNIIQCDFAFFGQKDAQQLIIIKKMVQDLNIHVKIITCDIVRSHEGLALSSRNRYLNDEQKKDALCLSKMLFRVKKLFDAGIKEVGPLFDSAIELLSKNVELEYLEFIDMGTFQNTERVENATLVAIAGKIGTIRLIDNMILGD